MGVDVIAIRCRGCRKTIRVPSAAVRIATKAGRPVILFCSRECNLKCVAKEGESWKRK